MTLPEDGPLGVAGPPRVSVGGLRVGLSREESEEDGAVRKSIKVLQPS